uniref:HMG box domain-containing protein n=1 Tax=Ditylum brightwellii TaxID=49249 RepID=A0A7S1Z6E2_9STRA|mmetsp:Transcript_25009/g.37328  ORF Transcript_25009/g.37328 Transcript_25009/m.37328 type:complete len:588 (+) Transcript_25009:267-2030(+)
MQQTSTRQIPASNMNNMAHGVYTGGGGPQDPNGMAAAMSAMASAQATQAGGPGSAALTNTPFTSQEHNAAAAAAHAAAAMAERNLSTAASRSMGGNGRNSWVQVDTSNALPADHRTFNTTEQLMSNFRQLQQPNFASAAAPVGPAQNDPTSQLLINPYGQQYNPSLQTAAAPLGMHPQQFQQQQQTSLTMNPYSAATNSASNQPNAALLASQFTNPSAAAANGTIPSVGSYTPLAMLGLNIPPQAIPTPFGLQPHQTMAGAAGTAMANKKKAQRKKNKLKPKRPLSAYNLFFKDERAKILKSIPDDERQQPQSQEDLKGNNSSSSDDDDYDKKKKNQQQMKKEEDNEESNDKSSNNAKKQKVPHGKIGFENLAKLIGKRWQNLDPERVEHYKILADKDMKRYKDEMEVFLTKQESDIAKEKKEVLLHQHPYPNGSFNDVPYPAAGSKKRKIDRMMASNNTMPMLAPGVVGMGPGFELFGAHNLQQMKDHLNNRAPPPHAMMSAGDIALNHANMEKQRRLEMQTKQLQEIQKSVAEQQRQAHEEQRTFQESSTLLTASAKGRNTFDPNVFSKHSISPNGLERQIYREK